MKIILVGPSHPYRGGISHYNTRLHRAMVERGHDVSIINFKRMYPNIFFPGKTQYDESESAFNVPSERLIDTVNPLSWIKAAKEIKSQNPDAVIFHWWQPFFGICFGAILSMLSNISAKKMFICHNVLPHESSFIDNLLSKMALSKVDRFIVHSEEDSINLLDIYPDAVSLKNFHPIIDLFGNNDNSKTIKNDSLINSHQLLFFGYIRKYKGLEFLLKAMPKMLKELNITLTVAGEFYDEKEFYLELINELGISKHVKVIDEYIPNEKVGDYFANSDLVVIPYISATQSGIVQIAYNFDLPVVVTRVGGLPEVVKDGETGYIVEPGSASAVADAVLDFFNNSRGESFRNNILKHKQLFSWENLVKSIESLIR